MTTTTPPTHRPSAGDAPVQADDGAATALEAGLAFRLGRAHRSIRTAWEARIADLGLSSPQASALRAVVEQPGTGLRELARTLHTDPMNAKRLADGLEDAGLLASLNDPDDRRRRALEPTAAGSELAKQVTQRALAWGGTLDSILGQDDVATLWRILARIEAGIAELPEIGLDEGADRG
jgi:DNA-binding MarR family transcriptional regulator